MAVVWVLTLVTLGLGLASAGPLPTSKPITTKRACGLGRFRSLLPTELEAFKKARDALEEWLLLKERSCSSRLFPRTWDLRQLQVWERPVALEAEIALTLKVLGSVTASSLGAVLDQPLGTLSHVHSELQACLSAQPPAGPRPTAGSQPPAGPRPRGRLHHWLHRLQKAPERESQECLQASVTSHLFHLIIQDLNCVASGDHCS